MLSKAASTNLYEVCARSLLDNLCFCSLGCEVVVCSPDTAKAKKWLLRPSAISDSNASSAGRSGDGGRGYG